MISNRPPTCKSSSPFSNPLVTVPKAPITIGIIVTFILHSFFNSLASSRYLSFFLHSFSFILFFFCCCWLLLGRVFWPRFGDPSECQSPKGVYMCHFLGQMLSVYIPFVRMVKFKFLPHLPVDHLAHPVVSSPILLLCQFGAFAYYVIDYYYYYYYCFCCCYYFTHMRLFHSIVSWRFLTGDFVTASLLKSPGVFPVLCLVFIIFLLLESLSHQR